MAAFGVTERDMPPARVRELGAEAGFRCASTYASPRTLLAAHHRPGAGGWWGDVRAWLLLGWLALARRHRHGALVVLRK